MELTDDNKKAILMQIEQGLNAQEIADSFRSEGVSISIGDVLKFLATVKNRARRYVNTFIVWRGRRRTLKEWSQETGLSSQTIRQRLEHGWDLDRVFTQPVRLCKNNVSKLRTA